MTIDAVSKDIGINASQEILREFLTNQPGFTKHSTIALVDYCVGESYATLKKLVAYNRRAYADNWRYKILSGNEEAVPVQSFIQPFAWLKAAYLFQLLSSSEEQDVEWFLWMDCDSLVTRFDMSVPQVLQEIGVSAENHIVVAADPHADFNTGVMFIRNCQWSRDLWKRALQKASNNTIREHPWWEQQALLDLYHENLHNETRHILVSPDRWKINAFQSIRRNEFNASSFVLHRVNCNEQPECSRLFESFFCATMPNGSYPEGLVDCSNRTNMTI
jgi:hypothetical protein